MPTKGKPYKIDTIKKEAYLNLLRDGGRRGASAKKIGLHRSTLANLMRTDKEFAQAVLEAEMDANEIIENSLFKTGKEGNTTAIQVWLYNRCPDRWVDRRRREHSGPSSGPTQRDDLSGMSNAQLEKRLKILRKGRENAK